MNIKSRFVCVGVILGFAIAIFCWSSQAAQPSSTGSGRLVVQRSPTVGNNVYLRLSIDGEVHNIGPGSLYDQPIPAGQHVLTRGHAEQSTSADFDVAYRGARADLRVHRHPGVGPRCVSAAIETDSLVKPEETRGRLT